VRHENKWEDWNRLATASKARELILAYGSNATAYQILNPGFERWFSDAGDVVVGYVRRGAWLVVAGEPVCRPDCLEAAIAEFEAFAAALSCNVCYVLAAEPIRKLLAHSDTHAVISIGAQPVWNPAEWSAQVRVRRSFRAQLHRSLNKGVYVEAVKATAWARHPEIRRTLLEWLESRRLPPMHFLVEPEVLSGVVDDRLLLVARREERIIAFLVASPVAACNGYLIEELARSPRAPNGTSELLIDAAMERFAKEGCEYATMGLVALASGTTESNPLWLRWLMYIARAHANRFYNFRGLEKFRAKMNPSRWERVYAISNERRFSPQALYAMGGAFSGISPIRAIGLAVAKGIREELLTLRRKLSK
jgi:phosphatidylglycerol lysyltransferase